MTPHSPTERLPISVFAVGGPSESPAAQTGPAVGSRSVPVAAPRQPAGTSGVTAAADTDRGRKSDSTAEVNLLKRVLAGPAGGLPEVGARYGDFLLLEEVGRGTFSRVFLARQSALADRPVVVKITKAAERESNALASLRHPNIVPIHSTHQVGDRHVVCMPHLGTVTLADVYRTLESMPSLPGSGRELFSTLTTRRAATLPQSLPAHASPIEPRPADAVPALGSLAGRSYVDAVLWVASRLADALAHAHDRGIVHRDLKPANILLADDGQPMLLDFNLASMDAEADVRGGTPAYMSPEQLEVFAGGPGPVDRRADLYSLGVMMFELLTRQSPFARHNTSDPVTLQVMLAERAGPPPRLRLRSRAVSPAVESIVRRCLEPDPAARYQSAHELKADLDRHLADRPLWHAAEPSARERAAKCWRRNRFRIVVAGLVAAAVVLASAAAVGFDRRDARLARLEATATANAFTADAQTALMLLADGTDRGRLDEGLQVGQAALARYAVTERPDWWTGRAVAVLTPDDQQRLRARAGELLAVLARVTARQAVQDAGRADPVPTLRRAFELNAAALRCYAGTTEPRSVMEHRAELARLLGNGDEARQLTKHASEQPADGPAGRLIQAHRHLSQGEFRPALLLLRDHSRDAPQDAAAWYMLGLCNTRLDQDAAAAGCFSTCVALRPDCPWAWYERGRVMERLQDHSQSRADLATATALLSDRSADKHVNGLPR